MIILKIIIRSTYTFITNYFLFSHTLSFKEILLSLPATYDILKKKKKKKLVKIDRGRLG